MNKATDTNKLVEEFSHEIASFFKRPLLHPNVVVADRWEDLRDFRKAKDGDDIDRNIIALANDKEIMILNENELEKQTTHKRTDFAKTLKHEISHVYYRSYFNRLGQPYWLDEGVAIWSAGQRGPIPQCSTKNISIDLLKNRENTNRMRSYGPGYVVVEEIMSKLGKDKLLEIINTGAPEERYLRLKKMLDWLK